MQKHTDRIGHGNTQLINAVSMADIRAGRTHSAQSVMDELKRDYGV